VGYIISYPLWIIGMMCLPHAIGSSFNFRKDRRVFLALVPVLIFLMSYCLLVFITKNPLIFYPIKSPLKFIFDIAYPLSDIIILTVVLILGTSYKFFGGKYKLSIYAILLGFCFQYIGDFSFSYTTTAGTYYNGSWVDLMFTTGMFLVSFGVLGFYSTKKKVSETGISV